VADTRRTTLVEDHESIHRRKDGEMRRWGEGEIRGWGELLYVEFQTGFEGGTFSIKPEARNPKPETRKRVNA
jgi:hypothetical protein